MPCLWHIGQDMCRGFWVRGCNCNILYIILGRGVSPKELPLKSGLMMRLSVLEVFEENPKELGLGIETLELVGKALAPNSIEACCVGGRRWLS